ncbi:MAG: divalent-cation tolerance protein CutA [Microvirgula sp.]
MDESSRLSEVLVVLVNVPDIDCARLVAKELVGSRLAACVNLLPAVESVYRWEGRVETASEVTLVIKSVRAAWPALEQRVQALHPYAVPEILALPVTAGLPAYINWVASESISSTDA